MIENKSNVASYINIAGILDRQKKYVDEIKYLNYAHELKPIDDKITSRAASGILKAHGVDHLICKSIDEYEKLIQFYLDNTHELKKLKDKVIQNKKTCSLFDNDQYVKNIEKGYFKIYENHKNNSNPQNFIIE